MLSTNMRKGTAAVELDAVLHDDGNLVNVVEGTSQHGEGWQRTVPKSQKPFRAALSSSYEASRKARSTAEMTADSSTSKLPMARKRKTPTNAASVSSAGKVTRLSPTKSDAATSFAETLKGVKTLAREVQRDLSTTLEKVGLREVVRVVDAARQRAADMIGKLDALDEQIGAMLCNIGD